MKSYNKLFSQRFYKSQLIDERFSKIVNTKGLKDGIEFLKSIGATKLDMENHIIKYKINQWTQNNAIEEEKLKEELLNIKEYVIDVKIEENHKWHIPEITIQTIDGIIHAMKFSAYIPKVKEIIPNIEEESRAGNCYEYAYYISLGLCTPNDLTTGYIYGYSDKSKFLHSWVEIDIEGEEFVIDATLNTIMNKDGYYLLQHAKPINKINNHILEEDLDNYPIIDNKNIPLEVYYVFRDEMIKELEKTRNIDEER